MKYGSLKYEVLLLESAILHRKCISIIEYSSVMDIIANEIFLVNKFDPYYVSCKIQSSDLSSIHTLEQVGYRFSEFRVQMLLHTSDTDETGSVIYPFKAEFTADKANLRQARKILLAQSDDDRFSSDPLIGNEFAKKRVVRNLEKSFRRFPNEFVVGLFHIQTDELLAFRTGAFLSQSEVHYYQYGVAQGRETDHTADLLESLSIALLRQHGVSIIHAITTGYNITELNRLTRNHGFKMIGSTVIMRKIFE